MKRLFTIALLAFASALHATDAAFDVLISQRKDDNSGSVQRNLPPAALSIWGFDSSKHPVPILLGSGLTLAGSPLTLTSQSGGTVLSFSSGNLSPLFTTSVATANTTPALSFVLSNQAANTVFAGPTSGGVTAPTFRSLVAADIPSLTLAKISDAGSIASHAASEFATSGGVTASGLTMTTARLLGRTTAATGAIEELTVGAGLTLSAGSLTANVTSVAGRTGAVTLAQADIAGLTTASSPVFAGLTDSGLTSGRVPFASTGGLLADISTLTFNSGTGVLSATGFAGSGSSLSGIVTSIAGTTGQVTASASTGAVTLSLPTALTSINSVTSVASTDLTFTGNGGSVFTVGNGAGGGFTLAPGTLASGVWSYTGTLDATNSATAGAKFASGVAIAKALWVGTTGNFGGEVLTSSASATGFHAKATASSISPYIRLESANRNWYVGAHDTGAEASFDIGQSPVFANSVVSIGGATNTTSFSGAIKVNDSTASTSTTTGSGIFSGGVGIAGALYTGGVHVTAASATGGAGLNIPHGTAPSSPVNGDFWSTTAGFYGRVNGATVGPFSVGSTSPTTTRGDLIARGASADQRLALASAGSILVSDGTDATWMSPGSCFRWEYDFGPQQPISGTTTPLDWSKETIVSGGSWTPRNDTWPHFGVVRLTTAATNGNGYVVRASDSGNPGYSPLPTLSSNAPWVATFIFKLGPVEATTTNVSMRIGLFTGATLADEPVSWMGVRYDTGLSDTNFTFCTRQASTYGIQTSSGVAADNAWHKLVIRCTTAGTVLFSLDGGAETSTASQVPTGNIMVPSFQVVAKTGSAKTLDVDYFSFFASGLGR